MNAPALWLVIFRFRACSVVLTVIETRVGQCDAASPIFVEISIDAQALCACGEVDAHCIRLASLVPARIHAGI